MDDLLDSAFDIAVFAAVLVSGLHAYWRGFVRESLNIVAWIVAIYAGIQLYPQLAPFVLEYVTSATAANWIAGVASGIGVLLLLSVVVSQLVRLLRRAGVGAVDRSLGFLFGLIRGAVLVSACFLILQQVIPRERDYPDWVRSAGTYPMMRAGAGLLTDLVPPHLREHLLTMQGDGLDAARERQRTYERLVDPPVAPGGNAEAGREKGYTDTERDALTEALRQLR